MGLERVVGAAAVVALALAALVIGCVVDGTWLSMCTALWYLALGFVWSMTAQGGLCAAQPGFVPVDGGGSGLCGGPLCALWGAPHPPPPRFPSPDHLCSPPLSRIFRACQASC